VNGQGLHVGAIFAPTRYRVRFGDNPLATKAYRQAEGDSLRRQLSAAFAYADKHDLELDTSLRDLGVSGFSGANRLKGALKSFKDRVESGDITPGSYLLIDSLDRLSRENIVLATHQLLGIALAGINVVTLNDERVFAHDADMGTMMLAVVEIERSHRESAEKGRKVFAAHQENKRRAREEGRVWTPVGPSWLRFDKATGKFVEIPEKVRVVRRMFNMFETGNSATVIAEDFNGKRGNPAEETLKPHVNRVWGRDTITSILKSRAVLGEYQPNKMDPTATRKRSPDGEAIPRYYGKAIVDPAQFSRVQLMLRSPAPRGKSAKTFNNLFVGLMKCAECGGTVGVHSNKSRDNRKRVPRLRCVKASTGGTCDNRLRLDYVTLEAAFLREVRAFELPGEQKVRDPNEDALATAIAERDDIATAVENLMTLAECSGDLAFIERYRARKATLDAKEAEIRAIKNKIDGGRAKTPVRASKASLERLLARLEAQEGPELYSVRAALSTAIKGVVDGMELHPNGMVLVNVMQGYGLYEFRGGAMIKNHGSAMATQPFSALVWDKKNSNVARVQTDPERAKHVLHSGDPLQAARLERIIAAEARA
jgi:DNA invertase Pin-like site-specific DNA recombinase